MKYFTPVLLIFLNCFSLLSQEMMVSFKPPHKITDNAISFSFSDPKTKELGLFLKSGNNISAYLLDKNHTIKTQLYSEKQTVPPKFKKYNTLIGGSIMDNQYVFSLSDDYNKDFVLFYYDFISKKKEFTKLDLKFTKEKFVQSFFYDTQLYILTVGLYSSVLNLYKINRDGSPKKHSIKIDSDTFKNFQLKIFNLYELLIKKKHNKISLIDEIEVAKIDSKNPIPLDLTSKTNKLYINENEAILTLDYYADKTISIKVDLKDYSSTVKVFNKPIISEKNKNSATNSYLYDNTIFQLVSNKKSLAFEAKNYDNQTILKSERVGKSDNISFKNTPIMQLIEQPRLEKEKELKKTAKLLRNISKMNGISVYKINDNYKITLGIEKMLTATHNFGYGGMGSFNGLAFNPALNSTYSYNFKVWIDCLFDKNYNHIQGDIPQNNYDKIDEFRNSINKGFTLITMDSIEKANKKFGFKSPKIRSENVYWHNDQLYYSFYFRKNKTFSIIKFEE